MREEVKQANGDKTFGLSLVKSISVIHIGLAL